jgi:hypothetical protein
MRLLRTLLVVTLLGAIPGVGAASLAPVLVSSYTAPVGLDSRAQSDDRSVTVPVSDGVEAGVV